SFGVRYRVPTTPIVVYEHARCQVGHANCPAESGRAAFTTVNPPAGVVRVPEDERAPNTSLECSASTAITPRTLVQRLRQWLLTSRLTALSPVPTSLGQTTPARP